MIDPDFHIFGLWSSLFHEDGSPGNLGTEPEGSYFTINTETERSGTWSPKPSTSIIMLDERSWGTSRVWEMGSKKLRKHWGWIWLFFPEAMVWWFHSDGFWMTWETDLPCAPWTVRILPPWCCLSVFSDVKRKSSSSMVHDSCKDLNK